MLRSVLLLATLISTAQAFSAPAAFAPKARLALKTSSRAVSRGPVMEDNSFLRQGGPKPDSLKAVGLSDDARAAAQQVTTAESGQQSTHAYLHYLAVFDLTNRKGDMEQSFMI
jgi:hypothetical protein